MKISLVRCAIGAALAAGLATSASAGDLKLTMAGGRVTIMADNVPLRQILQEWARVGQTTIVNADKMNGPAISLQLINALERDALDILLRSASGYIAAPRPVPVANAAFYDRVTIMASSRPPTVTASAAMPPTFQRPPTQVEESDEPINIGMPPPPPGNPAMGQFPGVPQQPGMMPPMVQGSGAPIMSPRPGAVQQPQVPQPPPGFPSPYQPYRPIPIPGGRGGGPGGGPGSL